MKYILVYDVDGYWDDGGGLKVDFFEDVKELDNKVEEIMTAGHSLITAGELSEYSYKTVEVIKKVVRE